MRQREQGDHDDGPSQKNGLSQNLRRGNKTDSVLRAGDGADRLWLASSALTAALMIAVSVPGGVSMHQTIAPSR